MIQSDGKSTRISKWHREASDDVREEVLLQRVAPEARDDREEREERTERAAAGAHQMPADADREEVENLRAASTLYIAQCTVQCTVHVHCKATIHFRCTYSTVL